MPLPVGVEQRTETDLGALSIVSLNVDALSMSKAQLLSGWFDTYDLVLLQEVGKDPTATVLQTCLPHHIAYTVNPARTAGVKGKGMLIAVKQDLHHIFSYHGCDVQPDCPYVQWCTLQLLDSALQIGNVYVPCSQAANRLHLTADQLFESVEESVQAHQRVGPVLLLGDWNASLGVLQEQAVASDLEQTSPIMALPVHMRMPVVHPDCRRQNAWGSRMHSLITSSGMICTTGRFGDCGQPTFCSNIMDAQSRIDHAAIDPTLIPVLLSVSVLSDVLVSDHKPVVLRLKVLPQEPLLPPLPIPVCHWKPSHQDAFVAACSDHISRHHLLESCQQLQQAPTSEIINDVVSSLNDSIVAAGFDTHVLAHHTSQPAAAPVPSSASRKRHHKVVLSQDALLIKAQLLGLIRGRVARHARADLRQQWRRLVRQGRQVYKQQQAQRIAYLLSSDRKQLWSLYKSASQSVKSSRLGPSAQAWTAHLQNMFSPPSVASLLSADTSFQHTLPPAASQQVLQPFDAQEVVAQLAHLKQRTSTGLDGVPACLLRAVAVTIGPIVSALFNAILSVQYLPLKWRVSYIAPIYKKGPWISPVSYRPIAVTPVLYRAFTKLVHARLSSVVEEHKVLPDYQFGFRPKRGVLQPLFVMRCLQDYSACHHTPVYAAFLDVSKAYDSVHQDTLFSICGRVGFSNDLVNLIRCLYDGAEYAVRTPQGLTSPVRACKGVKQGCPLSPLLFNLYTIPINEALLTRCSGVGVTCGGAFTPLRIMQYADDIVLLASTAANLQSILHVVEGVLQQLQLQLSVTKSKVMVIMRRPYPKPVVYTASHQKLEVVDAFAYLGLSISANPVDTKAGRMMSARLPSVSSAAYAFVATARTTGLHYHVPAYLHAMQTAVYGRCTFGAPIWGPKYLLPGVSLDSKFQQVINRVLRALHRLPVSTPTWGMLLHYGCMPLQYHIFKHVLQFWNSAVHMDSRIISQACHLACRLAPVFEGSWLAQLLKACVVLHDEADVNVPAFMRSPVELSWPVFARALHLFYKQHLQHTYCAVAPDHPDCPHRKHAVVCQWLHPLQGRWASGSPVLQMSSIAYKQQSLVSRFFTGSTHVATSHHSMHSVDYSSRACHLCASVCPGHEQHVLLHCAAVQHIRVQYPSLDFNVPGLRVFITAHSGLPELYMFVAAVTHFACGVPMHPP